MTQLENRVGLGKPMTLPRNFSRVLSKLIAMPAADSMALATAAYHGAKTPAQRQIAMKLRLRLLQEALLAQPQKQEDAPEEQEDEIIDLIAEPVEEPPEAPLPPKGPTMMKMDLESDALSLMMSQLSASDEDDENRDEEF